MATVTPNFNWPVPTSTDLVKDGATAIEALGDSIDASLVDLKGGTTGQVLSKNSNTDMDFTWVTDAAGDITAVTAGTGLTGGGTSGTVSLAVDPTYAGFTNLNYFANPTLNSAMSVWQRGTSFTTSGQYTADRWTVATATPFTISRQVTGDTTNLPNIQYCARVQRNSGATATNDITFTQSMESVNSIPFAGKTITLSFYARVGANYSGGASGFISQVRSGTGADQNLNSGYTGSVSFISNAQALTTTWTRYSYTGTVPTTATEIGIYTGYTPSGTAGANDYYEVTGVQIDIGSVALPFRTNQPTYATELAACQRYFYRYNAAGTTGPLGVGSYYDSTTFIQPLTLKQTMRTTPSATFNNPTNFTVFANGVSRAATSMTTDIGNRDIFSVALITSAATGGFAGSVNASNANASIDFNSEL